MAQDSGTINQYLASLSRKAGGLPPLQARSSGMEEVFQVYCKGNGLVSQDGPPFYINLNIDMFDFGGRWVGTQTGIEMGTATPSELLKVPPAPDLPIDEPPVPRLGVKSWTKGVFTFPDGALFVQGPAIVHLIPLSDGGIMFQVTTSHVVTKGTGVYQGVQGIKQGTGSTYVPAELAQSGNFPKGGQAIPATTIETFRLLRRVYQNRPSIAGSPHPGRPDIGSDQDSPLPPRGKEKKEKASPSASKTSASKKGKAK